MSVEEAASQIAAAIGEPARARMLFALLDGRARTSTELALVARVSPSTASVHLSACATRICFACMFKGDTATTASRINASRVCSSG